MSKEWEGNKSSWRSMLGIDKRYTNNDRALAITTRQIRLQ